MAVSAAPIETMKDKARYFHHALQSEDFSVDTQYSALQNACNESGAIVTFTGLVRDLSKINASVECIELHTYPAMTQQQIQQIGEDIFQRFDVDGISIIHRYGKLKPTEQIVLVGIASKHRVEAFSAAQMAMDFLKSQVTFWKKEHYKNGTEPKWIQPTTTDHDAVEKWLK